MAKLNISIFNYFSFWDRLVGDNIDHEILVRVQTKAHTNRSIHWTHQFAVLDRVQEPGLEDTNSRKTVKDLEFRELLPDSIVQRYLMSRWAVLVSRIVTKYLKPFNFLRKRVVWHIPHPYSKEMAQRSTVVSVYDYGYNIISCNILAWYSFLNVS